MVAEVYIDSRLKVIVADDHRLFRSGIILTLRGINKISHIQEAENGREVLELLQQEHYDVVLMDISMPVMNGVVATKEIAKQFPKTKVIAVSMYEDDEHIMTMFHAGASGYLFKNTDKNEIENALDEVIIKQNLYWPRSIGDKLFNKMILKKRVQNVSCQELFSDREKEIIRLICAEYSTKEIADYLHLSQKTVAWHRENLMQKSHAKNTAGLVVFALRHELAK
jgi:two-component system, NarL family, response regulator NreC